MAKPVPKKALPAQAILYGMLSGRTVKRWRNEKNLGAEKLGQMLGYSRSYIKAIEGGSLPVSKQFAAKFRELQQTMNGKVFEPELPKLLQIVTHFELPAEIEILSKPIKCRGCGKWIIPRTPNQKTHTVKACQRKAERKRRARSRRARR